MTLIQRFISFVPPALIFVLPAFSQLQGKLEQLPGNIYQVSVVPGVNWSPPGSTTNSAQITLRATAGKLNITQFQSITGNWVSSGAIRSPSEAPAFDYFSFSLSTPVSNITYQTGAPVTLFSFSNSGGCLQLEIIDSQADPFMPPNSMSVNIGNSFSVLAAGPGQNAYTGNTAESAVGCPPLETLVFAANNPVLCHGSTTSLLVQVFGGYAPYTVTWQESTTGNTGSSQIDDYDGATNFQNMPPGNYAFTIKDALDSTKQQTINVTQPAPLTVRVEAFDASCNGSMDGVAFVDKVTGGTAPSGYKYYWDNNPTVSSRTIGFLDPGTYTVTVVDDNGCQEQGSVEVKSFAVIFPNPRITQISCNGENDGVVDLYPVGVNPPFTYEWSSNVTSGDYSSAWQLKQGNYSVTITDATGVCQEVADFTIVEPQKIEVDYKIAEPKCFGDLGELEILAVANSQGQWQSGIEGLSELSDETFYVLEPGLTRQLVIEDAKGCRVTEEFIIPAKQEMILEIGEDQLIKYGQEIYFQPKAYPTQNVSFNWSPAEELSCSDCLYPIARPTDNTTFSLTMTDSAGCQTEDKVTINVRKSRDIYIPNAFSPNDDGVNDVFCPYGGFEITAIKSFIVFDRWGGTLYKTEGDTKIGEPDCGWDGTTRNKPADPGTYLFSMNVEFIDGEVVLFAGEIRLMR